MAVLKAVSSNASIGRTIEYVLKEEKTEGKVLGGIDIYNPEKALLEMLRIKKFHGKEGGREFKHYVYSLSPEESQRATLEQIKENALQIVRETPELQGYQCLVTVHDDKEHKHAHIILNSVNSQTGEKLRLGKPVLDRMKKKCNEISLEQGLTVPEKSEEITTWNKYESKTIEEGKSWKMRIAQVVEKALGIAKSRKEFEKICNENAVGVKYLHDDNRKNVTYFDPEGNQVRDKKLGQTFKTDFGKERIDREILRNNQAYGEAGTHERTTNILANAIGRLSESNRKSNTEDYGARIENRRAELSSQEAGRIALEAERRNAEEFRNKQERERIERRKSENAWGNTGTKNRVGNIGNSIGKGTKKTTKRNRSDKER